MKNILISLVLLFISFGVVRWIRLVESEENNSDKVSEFNSEKETISVSNKPDEVEDVNFNKKPNMELKSFFASQDSLYKETTLEYEKLIKTIDNYVQRYISLFLRTSNLLEYEIKDEGEEILIDLEISITGRDLAYLQSCSKSLKSSAYPKNFSKLDAIFSKIARAKERTYMDNAMRSSRSFLASLNIFSRFANPSLNSFDQFAVIFLATWTFAYFFMKHVYLFLGVIINSFLLWEGLNKYRQKIKESDTDIYVKTLQFSRPTDCDPANIGWYDSFMNLFFESKCLQYYKVMQRNPSEEVSLFNCILDTYSFYLVRTPIKLFGTSVKDLTGELSGLVPWPLRYITNIPMVLIVLVLSLFFVLVLCGKRLKLSFFGAGLEIGDVKVNLQQQKTAIGFDFETPKPIRVIRKLKPWTKSRFPKRPELGDNLKRRKLYLNASKSKTEVPASDELAVGSSSEACNSMDVVKS